MPLRLLLALSLTACGSGEENTRADDVPPRDGVTAAEDTAEATDPPAPREAGGALEDAPPFTLDGTGFTVTTRTPGMRGYSSPPGSGCLVEMRWWRPRPPDPGGPMQVASRREVTALGRTLEVLHTSMFEGRADEVDVVMLPGDGVHTRVVFRACGDVEIDGWLGALRPADGAPDPEAAARARAIQTAEAFVRAQGYTDVAPTVPDDEIVHEGIEGSVAMRRHQLAPRAVRADGRDGSWMVVFRYQDPQYAGRGRAVQLTAGETPRLIHQDLVLGPP